MAAGAAAAANGQPAGLAKPYVPGAASPLRGQEAALAACLRRQPQPFGVLVVELTPSERGIAAAVHGLDGDAARACVVGLAGKLARPQVPRALRCAVAFGELPVADAPGVEITRDEIRWLGRRIDPTATTRAAGDDAGLAIPALLELARAYADETDAFAASAVVVTLRGPVVLRAPDDAPMKLVNRVLATMEAAGVDLVLARQNADAWQLLRRTGPLPIVPVPVGTGGSWNHPWDSERGGLDDHPTLSLLVTTGTIQVRVARGTSQGEESVALEEISTTQRGPDLDKLERVLAEHRRHPSFAGRADVEIAGENGVHYGDLASVIERAERVGFGAARVVVPAALSTRPRR